MNASLYLVGGKTTLFQDMAWCNRATTITWTSLDQGIRRQIASFVHNDMAQMILSTQYGTVELGRAKSLPGTLLTFRHSDLSDKLHKNQNTSELRKSVLKYHLQNGGLYVQGPMRQPSLLSSISAVIYEKLAMHNKTIKPRGYIL